MPSDLYPQDYKTDKTHHMRRLFVAAACVLCTAQTLQAASHDRSVQLRADLQTLEQILEHPATHTMAPATLIAKAGLQGYVTLDTVHGYVPRLTSTTTAPAPVTGQAMDMRLGMTILTQSFGPKENKTVLDAQGETGRQALTILSGVATLADIRRLLHATHLQFPQENGVLTLDVPLIIWKGAQLHLLPGETLALNRTTGALILNFGHITVDGATITAVGEPNPHNERFRPFIATSGGGSAHLDQAQISGLGFGRSPKFSGFSLVHNPLFPVQYPTRIIDSLFYDIVGVAISGASDVTIQSNIFHNMRGSAVSTAQSRHVRVISNLFTGTSQTNAIRIEQGSGHAIVAGNVILNGERAGIVIRHNSHHALVTRNIVWSRNGGGIVLSHSTCSRVVSNLVMDNGQKGIEVRSSKDSTIKGNLVMANHSAGIWISAQADAAQTFVSANILSGNGSGIAAATGASIILKDNDFTEQFPQFLSGDLALQSRHIAQNITGQEQIILTAAGRKQNIKLHTVCPQSEARY